MAKNIWIIAEQRHGAVASSYYEMLSEIRRLCGDGAYVTAVCLGSEDAADSLRDSGADAIISAEHEKLCEYNPMYYTEALYGLIKAGDPDAVLVPASAAGSETAPGVAAKLKTGLAAHCTELKIRPDGELGMIAPAFGGKLMGEYYIPSTRPAMASVKPGVFERTPQESRNAAVTKADMSFLDGASFGVELVSRVEQEQSEMPIEKAEAVVCVGLGIGNAENLEKARTLAKALGASVCYTRPMVDMGYMENESAMIGTSGKTIKPKLYLGFGISGSNQHICGMKDSGMIISVNTDEKANIFAASNYKIVGDAGAILDELLKLL